MASDLKGRLPADVHQALLEWKGRCETLYCKEANGTHIHNIKFNSQPSVKSFFNFVLHLLWICQRFKSCQEDKATKIAFSHWTAQ